MTEASISIFVISVLQFSLGKKILCLEWYPGARSQLFQYRWIRLQLKHQETVLLQCSLSVTEPALLYLEKSEIKMSRSLLACILQSSTAQPHRGNSCFTDGEGPQLYHHAWHSICNQSTEEAQPPNQI